jgi:hypothetical protein
MRPLMVGVCLTAAVLFPTPGIAQVHQSRTPPPEVTAAAADWQINSESVLLGGIVYHATRGYRFFDGQVMTQIGIFAGVPVYADRTLDPFSVLYVPTSRDRVRGYEQRREGELAGTTGSRAPSFPVSPSPEAQPDRPLETIATGETIEPSPRATGLEPAPVPSAAGTPGTISPRAITSVGTVGRTDRKPSRRPLVGSIAHPSGANGVWLQFNGVRWYANGAAASFSPERFELVGEYRGFPVYRDKITPKDEIWVVSVTDGPLARYVKR